MYFLKLLVFRVACVIQCRLPVSAYIAAYSSCTFGLVQPPFFFLFFLDLSHSLTKEIAKDVNCVLLRFCLNNWKLTCKTNSSMRRILQEFGVFLSWRRFRLPLMWRNPVGTCSVYSLLSAIAVFLFFGLKTAIT